MKNSDEKEYGGFVYLLAIVAIVIMVVTAGLSMEQEKKRGSTLIPDTTLHQDNVGVTVWIVRDLLNDAIYTTATPYGGVVHGDAGSCHFYFNDLESNTKQRGSGR
jgi:hypothetical protein